MITESKCNLSERWLYLEWSYFFFFENAAQARQPLIDYHVFEVTLSLPFLRELRKIRDMDSCYY